MLNIGALVYIHLHDTYLFLLLIEIINNDTNEEVKREERTKDDEEHEVQVHIEVHLPDRLDVNLGNRRHVIFYTVIHIRCFCSENTVYFVITAQDLNNNDIIVSNLLPDNSIIVPLLYCQ